MKVLGLTFLTISSLLCMSSAFASKRPTDLEDLSKRWESVAKVANGQNLMSMEAVKFSANEDVYKLIKNSFEASTDAPNQIHALNFAKWNEGSRDKVLGELFPKGQTDLAFCSAFPEPKVKEYECTLEEKAEKIEKAKLKNCRTKVKEMLGGIFHTDPQVYFGDVTYADGSSNLVFYVGSALEDNSFLKYEFRRS